MAKKPFTNNPEKDVVRSQWDTPLLKHLHKAFGVRFRYCGLPGVDLLDVRLWGDMIEEVTAFEPLDHPERSQRSDRRGAITALRTNMAKYGIKGRAYCGTFEEVVVLRKDYEGTAYAQERLVTLYNLDFCNELASSVNTPNGGKQLWRFEAIRQILRDQHDCFRQEKAPSWFILMVTVRNQMRGSQLRALLRPTRLTGDAKSYHDECVATVPLNQDGHLIGTHAWAIKTLLFNSLCGYFANPNLQSLFFPVLLYEGTKVKTRDGRGREGLLPSPMMHVVVLCRFGDPENAIPEQWPNGFLRTCSVQVNRDSLRWKQETGEQENAGQPSSARWLVDHGADILRGL